MTPADLADTLDRLDITNAEAASICGITQSTLYRWLAGTTPIHPSAYRLLRLLSLYQPETQQLHIAIVKGL